MKTDHHLCHILWKSGPVNGWILLGWDFWLMSDFTDCMRTPNFPHLFSNAEMVLRICKGYPHMTRYFYPLRIKPLLEVGQNNGLYEMGPRHSFNLVQGWTYSQRETDIDIQLGLNLGAIFIFLYFYCIFVVCVFWIESCWRAHFMCH